MKITKYQLQQQINFAKGILGIVQEADMPESRMIVANAAKEYCESVIKTCELAVELLENEEVAKKEKAPDDVHVEAGEKPNEKPKQSRKKKKEEPVEAELIPAAEEKTDSDGLDDLF